MGFISFLISIVLIFVVCKINETWTNLADKLADIQRQVHKLQKFNAEFSNEELKQSQVLSESQKIQTDESIQLFYLKVSTIFFILRYRFFLSSIPFKPPLISFVTTSMSFLPCNFL